MKRITFRKGPIGYVVLINSSPIGSVKRIGLGGWQVNVPELNARKVTASGCLFQNKTFFAKWRDAKLAVERALL